MVPTEIARTLAKAKASMHWSLESGTFALLGFPEPPLGLDLAVLTGAGPAQVIREGGETTVLARLEDCAAILERHPAARREDPLVWIRFELAMDWELVGFLALVTGALAQAGVPLGAICGFSRDHLFVARQHSHRTAEVLTELFGPPSSSAP